jgi:hypothetical protein
MDDHLGAQLARGPPITIVRRRYANVPNTSGFWTDLYLARSAVQSTSVTLVPIERLIAVLTLLTQRDFAAACLHAMRWRTQGSIDRPHTPWDEMLLEMKWLREDFKCDAKRKKMLIGELAKPWDDGNRQRLQRMCSNLVEVGSGRGMGSKSSISGWARDEYLEQRTRSKDKGPEATSGGEGDPGRKYISWSPGPLPSKHSRKADPPMGARRSTRLRNLADANKS